MEEDKVIQQSITPNSLYLSRALPVECKEIVCYSEEEVQETEGESVESEEEVEKRTPNDLAEAVSCTPIFHPTSTDEKQGDQPADHQRSGTSIKFDDDVSLWLCDSDEEDCCYRESHYYQDESSSDDEEDEEWFDQSWYEGNPAKRKRFFVFENDRTLDPEYNMVSVYVSIGYKGHQYKKESEQFEEEGTKGDICLTNNSETDEVQAKADIVCIAWSGDSDDSSLESASSLEEQCGEQTEGQVFARREEAKQQVATEKLRQMLEDVRVRAELKQLKRRQIKASNNVKAMKMPPIKVLGEFASRYNTPTHLQKKLRSEALKLERQNALCSIRKFGRLSLGNPKMVVATSMLIVGSPSPKHSRITSAALPSCESRVSINSETTSDGAILDVLEQLSRSDCDGAYGSATRAARARIRERTCGAVGSSGSDYVKALKRMRCARGRFGGGGGLFSAARALPTISEIDEETDSSTQEESSSHETTDVDTVLDHATRVQETIEMGKLHQKVPKRHLRIKGLQDLITCQSVGRSGPLQRTAETNTTIAQPKSYCLKKKRKKPHK